MCFLPSGYNILTPSIHINLFVLKQSAIFNEVCMLFHFILFSLRALCLIAFDHDTGFVFQGYEHTVGDPAMLYRIETMPGLGW